MEPRVVQNDHAARWPRWQESLFKTSVHPLRVATALKHQRGHQLALLRSGNDAGALVPFARHSLINPFAPRRAFLLTIQAVIHAAFVQVKDGPTGQVFPFAAEQPALHLVALAIFCEFF